MSVRSLPAALALSTFLLGAIAAPTLASASASVDQRTPVTYELNGDAGGSKFEGIGYDARAERFYVSETTGGEIHRGSVRSGRTAEWLAGDGTDGRWTARGVSVDAKGRVYVAGARTASTTRVRRICGCTTGPAGCWRRCGPVCRTRSSTTW